MHTVVIVVHLMLVLAMIGVIMLQKSEGGGLGIGGGGGFMSSRGTANVLTRATAILAAGFFVTSLVLSIIAGHDRKPATVVPGSPPASQQQQAPAAPANQGGGVLNQLQRGAPSAPEVPSSK